MESSDDPVVAGDAFREAMLPTIRAVRDLVDEIENMDERHGALPSVSSQAMAEIAAESEWAARSDWENPVRDTHSFGAMTLVAARDYARAFAQTLDTVVTPVYAHMVMARSALEASVVSAWLNEPGIEVAERVRRGLCEQLYSAMELVRLKLEDDARKRVERWKATATALGWTAVTNRPKPAVESTNRPSVPRGIDTLVVGEGEWSLGRVEWSYLSSVSHVTWYGLRQALTESQPDDPTAMATVAYGTSSQSVLVQALCVMRALRSTATRRFVLAGWEDEGWARASRIAAQHELGLLRAHVSNGPAPQVGGTASTADT
jgi:hypothetical protein